MGNDERIQNLGKKQNLVEQIFHKCIFHDFKVNHVKITFFILRLLLSSINLKNSFCNQAFCQQNDRSDSTHRVLTLIEG